MSYTFVCLFNEKLCVELNYYCPGYILMRNVLWISVTRPKEREAWIVSEQQREQQRLLGAAALRRGRDQTQRAQSQRTGSQQEPIVIDSEPPAREASSTTTWEVTTSPAAPAAAKEMRKKQQLPARGKSRTLTLTILMRNTVKILVGNDIGINM